MTRRVLSEPPIDATRALPRVVVADDSAFMRRLVAGALGETCDVVGVAADGREALELCRRHEPDVLTLDLTMPGTDGLAVLRELQVTRPALPVVVVSAFSEAQGARAVDALAEGAFDLVAKPGTGENLSSFAQTLRMIVATAAARALPRAARFTRPALTPPWPSPRRTGDDRLVLIACSTGGPRALAELVPALPAPLGAGVLIVQHMPEGFTGSLAQRLDRRSRLDVHEACAGERPDPRTALIAPGGRHLRLGDDHAIALTAEPAVGGLRPRADLTIADAARRYGERLVVVVLTGMGRDGLDGVRAARRAGARILAEDESTCTVYGMPRAVAEAGLTDAVLPLGDLPAAIVEAAQ